MRLLTHFTPVLGAFALFLYACGGNPAPEAGNAPESAVATTSAPDGQRLFVETCAACHQRDRDAAGPALRGVVARWDNDSARLRRFIRDNDDAVAAGDPRAKKLRESWSMSMPRYPNLTDRDIDAILAFIETP